MKYIILHKLDLVPEAKKALDLGPVRKLIKIKLSDGSDSDYSLVSVDDDLAVPSLERFKRFSKEEVPAVIDNVATKKSIGNVTTSTSKVSAFADPEGKRARLQGAFKLTIPAGETASQDLTITEARWFTGVSIKGYSTNFGDTITVQVVHPVYGPVDTFVDNWYITDDLLDKELYPASLPAGLIVRITYVNVGDQESKVTANLYLHKV